MSYFPLEIWLRLVSPNCMSYGFPNWPSTGCLGRGDRGKEAQISWVLASPFFLFFVTPNFVSKDNVFLLHSTCQKLNYLLDWWFWNIIRYSAIYIISQRKDLTSVTRDNLTHRRSAEEGAWLPQLALLVSGEHWDKDEVKFSFPFHGWNRKLSINTKMATNSTKALIETNTMQAVH